MMMSRALLVIDVQNEYFTGALPITHPAGPTAVIRAAGAAPRGWG
jgi:nicotinamidase-related amidase